MKHRILQGALSYPFVNATLMHMKRGILSLWFIRLRWFAFLGQILVLYLSLGPFGLTLPWKYIAAWILLIPISNIFAGLRFAKSLPEKHLVGGLLVLDTFILTAVLYYAGGPTNPFTIVYLLHVVLAAIMLTPLWTWGIAVLTACGFAFLFAFSLPVAEWGSHGAHHGFSLHLHGMLFAYVVVSLLVAYFLNKILAELQKRELKLQHLEYIAANQERLTSLTTITANAAHELGTPLATIAVVSHELELALKRRLPDTDLLEDISLLKNETERCKTVIRNLSERSGDLIGEEPVALKISDLLYDAIAPIKNDFPIKTSGALGLQISGVPRKALTLALRALVKNALEASKDYESAISIVAKLRGDDVELEIKDSGAGMDEATLERIGEPFFSTKGPESGMGLGVYLSRLTVEQLGGTLVFSSRVARGTLARLTVPLDCTLFRVAA